MTVRGGSNQKVGGRRGWRARPLRTTRPQACTHCAIPPMHQAAAIGTAHLWRALPSSSTPRGVLVKPEARSQISERCHPIILRMQVSSWLSNLSPPRGCALPDEPFVARTLQLVPHPGLCPPQGVPREPHRNTHHPMDGGVDPAPCVCAPEPASTSKGPHNGTA